MPFLLIWMFSVTAASAISDPMDSLIYQLESVPENEARVDMLNALVSKIREKNIYQAVKYGTEAQSLAERLQYQKGLGLALENLGWIYYRRGIYSDAFEFSQRALLINTQLGDSISIARCLNNIGAISYEKSDYEEAIESFRSGYLIAEKGGDFETVVRSLNNISFSHLGLNNMDSAVFYSKLALERSELDKGGHMIAFSYRILGDIAAQQNNPEQALSYYQECMRISEATDNFFIQASTLHRIGKLYIQQRKYDQALNLLNVNEKIAGKNGFADELERTYKLITDIKIKTRNADEASYYLQKYLELHDSLVSQRNTDQLALLSAGFEAKLQDSKIELLLQDAKLKEEELNSHKAWNYFYIGCIMLGIIVAVVLYISNQRIKRINIELKNITDTVSHQAQQLSSINNTKDKLLSIISHDIRSPLSSLRGMLNIVDSNGFTNEEFVVLTKKIGSQLDAVYDDLGNLLQWTQSQLQGLKVAPEVFDLKSVCDDVAQLLTSAAKSKNIEMVCEIDGQTKVKADANHVRLIMRNLISNAIKFSRENGRVTISHTVADDMVKVSVSDNGIGIGKQELEKLFDATTHFSTRGTANEKGMGVGLLLTKEFTEKNGGSVSVKSDLGKGSVFTFSIPMAL